MFKGPEKDIEVIYTAPSSSAGGLTALLSASSPGPGAHVHATPAAAVTRRLAGGRGPGIAVLPGVAPPICSRPPEVPPADLVPRPLAPNAPGAGTTRPAPHTPVPGLGGGRTGALTQPCPRLSGKAEGPGGMHVTLCDFIVPWDTLSATQKKSLNHRYQMGCECKVSPPPHTPQGPGPVGAAAGALSRGGTWRGTWPAG
ncbi:PREDICTED: metalloproteinase inhibitor 2 [Condylura cristata]|uniref:metalloproteinase inhibitor 2 n=1 Tax=Condylura cristata TaxID=143302 RepID=UPI00064334D6|nr:PREDICTED: metalloproteinase inhibitor 2 [Condylura cristata]